VGFVDLPPGYESPMHFTNSQDYIVVMNGEIEITFMDGVKKTLVPGNMVVQCAAAHLWSNKTEKWARFLGISMPSEPVVVGGKTLDEEPYNAMKFC